MSLQTLYKKSLFIIVVSFFCVSNVYAGEGRIPIFISISSGPVEPDVHGFDSSTGVSSNIGVNFEFLSLAIGHLDMDEFDSKSVSNTHISVEGFTLSAIKPIHINDLFKLDLTAGVYSWEATSKFLGNKVGEDDGADLFIGAAMRLQFHPNLGVFFSVEEYFEVSNTDISRHSIGATWTF